MLALRQYLSDHNWFSDEPPQMAEFLDLVALGTIADVVPLDYNNRILVYQGIMRMKTKPLRPGMEALLDIAKRDIRYLSTDDFGFQLAPRLNAAGRLEDMTIGINCLLSTHYDQAHQLATQLHELNLSRRQIDQKMQASAHDIVNNIKEIKTKDTIVLYHPKWHQGVIGIVASKIKETHHRPTVIFTQVDKEELKGSARSIPGINLKDVLTQMSAKSPDLLIGYGGHAMAAGMSILVKNLDFF